MKKASSIVNKHFYTNVLPTADSQSRRWHAEANVWYKHDVLVHVINAVLFFKGHNKKRDPFQTALGLKRVTESRGMMILTKS